MAFYPQISVNIKAENAVKDQLVFKATSEHVAEEYTVQSSDGTGSITFHKEN